MVFYSFISLSFLFKFFVSFFLFLFGLKILRKLLFTDKSIMIILGSGGHTGELILMLKKLNFSKFSNCYFISAFSDINSDNKVKENFKLDSFKNTKFHFIKIYRCREIGQSALSSVISTIIALFHSLYIILITRPSIIVTNGPGTAVPLVLIGYILKKLFILIECKIMFIESYCRSKCLSRTGLILSYISDKFIVLWEDLKGGNREYLGKIL